MYVNVIVNEALIEYQCAGSNTNDSTGTERKKTKHNSNNKNRSNGCK